MPVCAAFAPEAQDSPKLWGNTNPTTGSNSFATEVPVLVTLIWVVVVIAIFGTLGARRYRSLNR